MVPRTAGVAGELSEITILEGFAIRFFCHCILPCGAFEECGDFSGAVAAVRGETAAAGAVAAGNGEAAATVPAGLTEVVSPSNFGCSNASLRQGGLHGDMSSVLTFAIATAANWRWAVTNQKATSQTATNKK